MLPGNTFFRTSVPREAQLPRNCSERAWRKGFIHDPTSYVLFRWCVAASILLRRDCFGRTEQSSISWLYGRFFNARHAFCRSALSGKNPTAPKLPRVNMKQNFISLLYDPCIFKVTCHGDNPTDPGLLGASTKQSFLSLLYELLILKVVCCRKYPIASELP